VSEGEGEKRPPLLEPDSKDEDEAAAAEEAAAAKAEEKAVDAAGEAAEAKAEKEAAKADAIVEVKDVKIITYNIFQTKCKNSEKNISQFISDNRFDIVCTQEDRELSKILSDYRAMFDCGKDTDEKVQMYVLEKFAKQYDATGKCISYQLTNLQTERYAIITSLTNVQDFKIVSLHLEGGRYADQQVLNDFNKVMNQKMGLLKKVIKQNPEIICGDFNSVYSTDTERLNEFLNSQYEYFRIQYNDGEELTDENKKNIKEINLGPFNYLKDMGYDYAKPKNEMELVTNGRGNTIIDCFWYKKERVRVNECIIIDKNGGKNWEGEKSCKFSDHNPVSIKCDILKANETATVVKPIPVDAAVAADKTEATEKAAAETAAAEAAAAAEAGAVASVGTSASGTSDQVEQTLPEEEVRKLEREAEDAVKQLTSSRASESTNDEELQAIAEKATLLKSQADAANMAEEDSMVTLRRLKEKNISENKEVLKTEQAKLAELVRQKEAEVNPELEQQILIQERKIEVQKRVLLETEKMFETEKVKFEQLQEQQRKEEILKLIRETGPRFKQTLQEFEDARKKVADDAAALKLAAERQAAELQSAQQAAVTEATQEVVESARQEEVLASEVFYKKFNTRYFDGTDFITELSNIETGKDSVKTALQYDKLGKIGKIDIQLLNPNAKEEQPVQTPLENQADQVLETSSELVKDQSESESESESVKQNGGALESPRDSLSEEDRQKPGILNEINNEFKLKEETAQTIKDKYAGADGFIKKLETINASHNPTPGEGGEPTFISDEQHTEGEQLLISYLRASRSYLTDYSLPYIYKKLMNLFIYYITYYNKFQNSFLIKKLENLRNSSKYKIDEEKVEIDTAFVNLANKKISQFGSISSIDNFFKYHFNLNGPKFTYIQPLVDILKVEDLDEHVATGLDNTFVDNYKEIVTDLKKIFQGEGAAETKQAVANVKIADLNTIIFKYISARFPIIKQTAENRDLNSVYFQPDIALLGFIYFIILKLAENFKNEYNKLIAGIFNNQATYSVVSNFFNKYSDSSVISYVKIRDGANEKEEKNQLSNPRYIYYSDIDFLANKGRDGLSLGLEDDSPSATLSLFYCNDPTQELKIPETMKDWQAKKQNDPLLISGNDLVLEALDYDKLDDEKSNIFPKYDHLFHFGHFNKILHNDNNEKFGTKMTEVMSKLTSEPLSDVFIIGYGASGAGKTTTLIYDKNRPEGKRDGAVVYMLNKLAQDPVKGDKYQEITLTITELFMAEPDKTTKTNEIFPTLLSKITNQKFTYQNGIFKGTINYDQYKEANDAANTGLPGAMDRPEYEELFLQKGTGLEFESSDTKDFTLSEILQLLIDKKRKVSGTTNNPQSSRSHVLSSISFTKVTKNDTTDTLKLYIGDFAGVENKFDYSSFKYGDDLNRFPGIILEQIYELASKTDFPSNEDGTYLKDYQSKVQQLLEVQQAEDLTPELEKLNNINILIHSICLLNPDLLGKTIKDYAFLKHPKEKYEEVYDKSKGRKGAWKDEYAGNVNEIEEFDKTSPLVYFYELLKPSENTDSKLMKKVGEMIPMIKFLTNSKTGYGDSYRMLKNIEKIVKEYEETKVNIGDPSIFKPKNTGTKSANHQRFLEKEETETQLLQVNESDKAEIDEKFGLLNPYKTDKNLSTKYPINANYIKKFEIKHPGFNIKEKSNYILEKQININSLLQDDTLKRDGLIMLTDVHQYINPKTDLGFRPNIDLKITMNDKGKVIKAFKNVYKHNRIFAAICGTTLLKWLKESPNNCTSDFPQGGNAWGNFIEEVVLELDDEFNFKISELELASPNKFLTKKDTGLGLVSEVFFDSNNYTTLRDMREVITTVRFNRSDPGNNVGTDIKNALDTLLNNPQIMETLKEKIITNFNNPNAPERDKPIGSISLGGVVQENVTFNGLKEILTEMNKRVEPFKQKIREKSSKETQEIQAKIEVNNRKLSELGKLIQKEIDDEEKYLMLAEAAVKRIYHIHYEVIKRTYEGLFINKSLEQMRFTMTDVLQATNKVNGQSTKLVPNFNSKCTNYYSNVLLEDLFQENTGFDFSDYGETDDDEDPDKVDNRNRFNVIHQIIAKNKIIGSISQSESSEPNKVTTQQVGGSVRQVGGKETQVTITNKTETHKIIQDTITDNLKGGITYCVCLLLNNSYIETQNKKLVNNPPKIPYIDLTEAYTELNRFYRRNKYIEEQKPNPSNLVFVKYYSKEDKRGGRKNYLLTKSVRESITEITGFSYEEFTSKNFHIHIFENINTYMLYCYSAAIKNFTIPPGKISEINKEFEHLKELANFLRESMDSAGVRIIQAIINQAKKYLFLIEVMNGTSVIGTIDFADEISKYNLKYNKSSVSQFNILHKSRSELYASDYDYLRRFRYFLDGVAPNIENLALGVHAFIPITPSVRNLVWRCFILPALLKLGEGYSIYHSLIKNKMKICLEHSTNPLIKEILKPYRDESTDKDLMKLTTVEIDDIGEHDDYLKEVNVSKESFDIIKVSKANEGGQPEGKPVLKFEVPQATSAPGISIELDYPEDYNDDAGINEQVKPLVTKLNSLPPKLRMEKIIEKITNIKNQRFFLKTLIDTQTKNKKILAFKSEIKALQEKETREEQEKSESILREQDDKRVAAEQAAVETAVETAAEAEQAAKNYIDESKKLVTNQQEQIKQQNVELKTAEERANRAEAKLAAAAEAASGLAAQAAEARAAEGRARANPLPNIPRPTRSSTARNTTATTVTRPPSHMGRNLPPVHRPHVTFRGPTPKGQPWKGGSKTKKYSKLKQPKKIERKYKQSLKNKVKVNHTQVNRANLLNKRNNKTKKHLRLRLKEKKKVERKYKQSLKNKN